MGAFCNSLSEEEKNQNMFFDELKIYKTISENSFESTDIKKKNLSTKLREFIKLFFRSKKELTVTAKEIHDKLFNDLTSTSLEIRDLAADDFDKFLFFFNKRAYKHLKMENSHITFPKFFMQYYPKYSNDCTKLESFILNDSTIKFDTLYDNYKKAKSLTELDLSFNRIESLPKEFKAFENLKKLILKRNNLKELFEEYYELKDLVYIDCSENNFLKFPSRLFDFVNLKYVNFNMNQIETFDNPKVHNKLEYLYFTNNIIKEIPSDIINFKILKHLALDKNRIVEIDIDIFRDYDNINLKITLSDNPLKIKGEQPYLTKDKLEISKIPKISQEEPVGLNQQKTLRSVGSLSKKNSKILRSRTSKTIDTAKDDKEEKKKKETRYVDFLYKQISHPVEKLINDKIEEDLQNGMKGAHDMMDEKVKAKKLRDLKLESVKNFLIHKIIAKKNEAIIRKFTDTDLKQDLRDAYEKYKKDFEKKILDSKKIDFDELDNNNYDHAYKKQQKKMHYLKLVAEDSNNLVFLKALSQKLGNSKIRINLGYLRNFDNTLFENMRSFCVRDEMDSSSLILFCSDLQLFIEDMIKYYLENIKGGVELNYKIRLSSDNNLVKFFVDENVKKILYCIGLSDLNYLETDFFNIHITNLIHLKHKVFDNFLLRFIVTLKIENSQFDDVVKFLI